MHNNTYMILDDDGVVIAQYMTLDIALILLRALCETYYADPTGWTIIADNVEVTTPENDNNSTVTWDEKRQMWKQPAPMSLAKQVADLRRASRDPLSGSCSYPTVSGAITNKSKVADEKEKCDK